MNAGRSKPCRVLVVEDEPLIALDIEDALAHLGCECVGPVGRLAEALAMAEDGDFDCAVLDVNVRGGHTYPVADLLARRGCPFLLASGYGAWTLPRHLAEQPRLTKPYSAEQLDRELRRLRDRVAGAHRPGLE